MDLGFDEASFLRAVKKHAPQKPPEKSPKSTSPKKRKASGGALKTKAPVTTITLTLIVLGK